MKSRDDYFLVVDSDLYGAANLQRLGEIHWLTRVPETLTEAKRLVVGTIADEMTALPDEYAYLEAPSDDGDVARRWLVVCSPLAAQREEERYPARRWVVERSISWLGKRRCIRVRWCK